MERAFTFKASTSDGQPLTGAFEIHPGGVTDERRIATAAWHRAVDVARTAGADIHRLVRVSRAATKERT